MSRPPIDHDTLAPGMRRQLARLEAALADGMPRRGWKPALGCSPSCISLAASKYSQTQSPWPKPAGVAPVA